MASDRKRTRLVDQEEDVDEYTTTHRVNVIVKPVKRKKPKVNAHVALEDEAPLVLDEAAAAADRNVEGELDEEEEDTNQQPINSQLYKEQPNDTFEESCSYEVKEISNESIYKLFYVNYKSKNPDAFAIAKIQTVFSSFFTLFRRRVIDKNSGEDKQSVKAAFEHARADNFGLTHADDVRLKSRCKEMEKAYKKYQNESAEIMAALDSRSRKKFEIVIPKFGCATLAAQWEATAHPMDFCRRAFTYRFLPNQNFLHLIPSGSGGDQNAPAKDAIQQLCDRASLQFFWLHPTYTTLNLGMNVSALARVLSQPHHQAPKFDSLLYSAFLRAIATDHLQHLSHHALVAPIITEAAALINNQQLRPKRLLSAASDARLSAIPAAIANHITANLYEYQKQAVQWMASVEYGLLPLSSPDVLASYNALFSFDVVANRLFVKDSSYNPVTRPIPHKGGLLADEMGLGKTLEMLSLIAANPAPVLNENAITDAGVGNCSAFIKSRATLVVAPNHLVGSVWRRMFLDMTKGLEIVCLTTKFDFAKVTVEQLIAADIVVASAEFLSNDGHLHAADARREVLCKTEYPLVVIRTTLYCQKLSQTLQALAKTAPDHVLGLKSVPLHLFRWHRLIIDESHDLLCRHGVDDLIGELTSLFTWCVTGTPFVSASVVERMCNLVGMFDNDDNPDVEKRFDFSMPCYIKTLLYSLTWRSTKRGVEQETAIPPMEEHIHVLDFSPTERGLYNIAKGDITRQRELCCRVRLLEDDGEAVTMENTTTRTLQDVENLLIQTRLARVENMKKVLAATESKLNQKEAKMKAFLEEQQAAGGINLAGATEQLEKRLKKVDELAARKRELDDEIASLEREIAFFEMATALREHIQFDKETNQNVVVGKPCPVCLEESYPNPAITSCGHLFCATCIYKTCKNVQGKCPTCRKALVHQNDILPIAINDAVHRGASKLVDKYGTKMGNLIDHLREVWAKSADDKVIIFGSRDADLQQLGKFFAAEQIETTFCRGNVAVRNKAIERFNDPSGSAKVMMLSLEKGAAGSNLTVASEVILLDSIWEGTQEQQIANDLQALNRAHRVGQTKRVRVVRFLIRNTVEMERYKQQRPDFDDTQALVVRDFKL